MFIFSISVIAARPVFSGGYADDLSKSFGEIIRILEAHAKGDVFDRPIAEIQQLTGFLHFHLQEVINGSISRLLLEQV